MIRIYFVFCDLRPIGHNVHILHGFSSKGHVVELNEENNMNHEMVVIRHSSAHSYF